jgi:NhaA family Na+:H+ antiporter
MNRLGPLMSRFSGKESAAGYAILIAATLGLVVANSPGKSVYFGTLESGFEVGGGVFYLKLTVLKIVNYLLMSIFFFLVGVEIKREITTGHLATFRRAIMPFIAAVGGMAVPAALYLLIAGGEDARGWGVPVATDIALAVGLLAIIGNSVLPSLRVFLLSLAAIDDIAAILIIAFIYTTGLALSWLIAALLCVAAVLLMNKLHVRSGLLTIGLGLLLWYCLYRSGVHPTLAGVVMGLLIPQIAQDKFAKDKSVSSPSQIALLEAKLTPWSAFVVVPIFAFANTGVELSNQALESAWTSFIAWGIFIGLVIGKPLGVLVSMLLARKLRVGDYPENAKSADLLATGSAAGIGFTVAIFIANLAFADPAKQDLAVIAVIAASIVSGILSWALFTMFTRKNRAKH